MNANQWVAIIVGIFSIIAGFSAFVKWLVQHFLYELKPNGGGSIKDQVNINSERLTRVESRVDDIYKILCERHKD